MKVSLINLRTRSDHAFLNLGALYVASSIRSAGHELEFVDLVRHPMDDAEVAAVIKRIDPDLIAFSGIITTYYRLKGLSQYLRLTFPSIPQLLGGSVGQSALGIIESYTPIDFVCAGEGEDMAIKFLDELKGERRWADVPNLHYRVEGSFRMSRKQGVYAEDLDALPLPAYDLVDMDFYIDYATSIFGTELADCGKVPRVMPMVFSRGCPFSCSFCYRLIRRWRHHSAENIVAHLKVLKDRYGIGGIALNDELVFVDRGWFVSACDAILASGVGIKFSCGGGKPSMVTEDIMAAMKRTGFRRIGYGVESGSSKILKLMRKEVTVEGNFNALALTLKYGMISRANFVFGHPGEDKKTIRETLDFIDGLYKLQERYGVIEDHIQVWFATAYPGSPMWEMALAKGIIHDEESYLIKVTSQDKYLINLSELRSVSQLRNYVYRGLTELDIKKHARRKQYRQLVTDLKRLALLYIVYFMTLGRFAKLSDLLEATRLMPSKNVFAHIKRAKMRYLWNRA